MSDIFRPTFGSHAAAAPPTVSDHDPLDDVRQTIQALTAGLMRLPHAQYARPVQHFLREYLGTMRAPAPFGGRAAQLAALDEWLGAPDAPSYGLLIAEAGRGKSALLVRWLHQPQTRAQAEVVFLPISLRFGTARAESIFPALAAHLAHLHGEPLPTTALGADQWRRLCQSYLGRPLPMGRPLLIVLDGLDEAADWRPDAGLFPRRPPPGLRLLFSARPHPGATPDHGWRVCLGWEQATVAATLPLPPLDREGLTEVLAQLGNPLDHMTSRVHLTTELFRLTQGDPLLVRLYVEALLTERQRAGGLSPDALPQLTPGLSGYFERWWQDQQAQWAAQGRNPLAQREGVQAFCELLACALGPLTHADLAAIIQDGPLTQADTVASMAMELGRFVIGDGQEQGYTFAHPRLAYHFWDALSPKQRSTWEERFLTYGQRTLVALNSGGMAPNEAPMYVLHHYGAHLERAHAPLDALAALLSEGWLRAWEAHEGTYSGFLTDSGRAWARADRLFTPDHPPATRAQALGVAVHAALCQASVGARSANIMPNLLALALQNGVLTPTQALVIARQTPDEEHRAGALGALIPHLPSVFLPEIMAMMHAIPHERNRTTVLQALAPHLHGALLAEALEAAHMMQDVAWRAQALAALVPHLPDLERLTVIREAMAAVPLIKEAWWQTKILAALAPHLSEAQLTEALTIGRASLYWVEVVTALAPHLNEAQLMQVLGLARETQDSWGHAEVLAVLASYMGNHVRPVLLVEALHHARRVEDPGVRAAVLATLAPQLPAIESPAVLTEALEAADTAHFEERARALAELAPYLSGDLLDKALEAARAFQGAEDRARILGALLPQWPEAARAAALTETLEAARAIQDGKRRAMVLGVQLPQWPEAARAAALEMALEAARAIEDSLHRAKAFAGLAPSLSDTMRPALLTEALQAARALGDEWQQASLLRELARHLHGGLLQEGLAAARAFQDAEDWSYVLEALAFQVEGVARQAILDEALSAVRAIQGEHSRAFRLRMMIPSLSGAMVDEALSIACAVQEGQYQFETLGALAPHLTGAQLDAALGAARTIQDPRCRAQALAVLARYFPDEARLSLWGEAFNAVRVIPEARSRADVLAWLVYQVDDTLRAQVLEEALETARAISDVGLRAQALVHLARALREDERPAVLGEVLGGALTIQDEFVQSSVLRALASQVQGPLLAEVMEVVRTLRDERSRAETLRGLAPQLSGAFLVEALDVVGTLQDEGKRAYALGALAPHLQEPLLTKALEDAQRFQDAGWRAKALVAVAPYLQEEAARQSVVTKVLGEIHTILEESRVSILVALAPLVGEAGRPIVLTEGLEAVRSISYEQSWSFALWNLIKAFPEVLQLPYVVVVLEMASTRVGANDSIFRTLSPSLVALAETHPDVAYAAGRDALHIMATRPRSGVLVALGALLPFLLALVGEAAEDEAAGAILHALGDVTAWWPA